MIIQVTLKSPDGYSASVDEAVHENLPEGLSQDEIDAIVDERKEEADEALAKWFEYKEYVTIEVDTEKGTARVIPRDE